MTQELMQYPMDPTGRHLRIVSEKPGLDLAAAERAAEDFLTALGVDLGGDGLAQTRPGWRAPTRSCSTHGRCG